MDMESENQNIVERLEAATALLERTLSLLAERQETLAGDVERWLADETVSVYRGTVAERLGRWARRHRTAVVGATVLGLAILLGVGLLAWQSERGRRQLEQEQAATNEARQQAEENARRERQAIRDYFVRTAENPACSTG